MITRRQAITQTCCAVLGLALPRWNPGQNRAAHSAVTAPNGPPDLQIQSSVLRIEFDHSLRSRVVALLGSNPTILAPFAASEIVIGIGTRIWSDFALNASHRERVSDAFG